MLSLQPCNTWLEQECPQCRQLHAMLETEPTYAESVADVVSMATLYGVHKAWLLME